MKRILSLVILLVLVITVFTGCSDFFEDESYSTYDDINKQDDVAGRMAKNQSTPTDINYSLERYNLIRRAYWVNGERERANSLVCQIEKPLGYIVLFSESGAILGKFIVDGKVTYLNSYLTPDYSSSGREMADVAGTYGDNADGIFFFTPDGKYIEFSGKYLYSDIPFEIENPILKVGTDNE